MDADDAETEGREDSRTTVVPLDEATLFDSFTEFSFELDGLDLFGSVFDLDAALEKTKFFILILHTQNFCVISFFVYHLWQKIALSLKANLT